jgi:hypothetical protein
MANKKKEEMLYFPPPPRRLQDWATKLRFPALSDFPT